MLTTGETHNVKFKVNVMGTSAEPRVRLILGTSPELSYEATKDEDGWVSNVNVPHHIAPGEYPMRVEVHLNNRLFTPYKRSIEVLAPEVQAHEPAVTAAPVPEPKPVEIQALPPEPKPKLMPQLEPVTAAPVPEPKPEVVMPKVVAKMPEVKPKKDTKPEEPKKPATLSLLSKISKAPAKKQHRVHTDLPKPTNEAAKPITVSLKEIDAGTSAPVRVTTTPVVQSRVKSTANPLVQLIKEEVFYA